MAINYSIQAESKSGNDGNISVKESKIEFGTTSKTAENLPNPAELFLGAFASCILKNVMSRHHGFSIISVIILLGRIIYK